MKECSRCKQSLSAKNFSKSITGKQGLRSICKQCDKKYRQKNKERNSIYHKLYKKTNKDIISKKSKEYYRKNTTKLKLKYKNYRKLNPEKEKKRHIRFYKNHPKYNKDYYKTNLKKIREQNRKWKKRNPKYNNQYHNSLHGRDIYSNKKFKVSVSDMLEWQDYKCAICQEKENHHKLHIDHDHKNQEIRMLLCRGCNTGTKITDNIELLKTKIEYIKTYSS